MIVFGVQECCASLKTALIIVLVAISHMEFESEVSLKNILLRIVGGDPPHSIFVGDHLGSKCLHDHSVDCNLFSFGRRVVIFLNIFPVHNVFEVTIFTVMSAVVVTISRVITFSARVFLAIVVPSTTISRNISWSTVRARVIVSCSMMNWTSSFILA